MSDPITMAIVNWNDMVKGLHAARKTQVRFGRSELKRGLQRTRKSFINKQLKGRPGLEANRAAKGKNIWTFAGGNSPQLLFGKIGISRLLHTHEKGIRIQAKLNESGHALLDLHEKGTGPVKNRPIIAVVPQIKLPARLHFKQQVEAEAPGILRKVAEAEQRGIAFELEKALKKKI